MDELEATVMTLETDIHTAEERSTTETVEIFQQDYVGGLLHATKLLIRERLELQCQLDNEDEDHVEEIERQVRRLNRFQDDDVIRPSTPGEIKEILKGLNRKG
ncbi:hypothetical protein NQ315_013502 [Exocentrus adspersus]|uniref:Uncharacterized protein n=1 Tax=Exocentrus adspersus TaxID=1586481 RepID=A0AAV8V8V5_9CUCU|nr:hypothetical protein NQ315_013502 [Exocentrus adspersus]